MWLSVNPFGFFSSHALVINGWRLISFEGDIFFKNRLRFGWPENYAGVLIIRLEAFTCRLVLLPHGLKQITKRKPQKQLFQRFAAGKLFGKT